MRRSIPKEIYFIVCKDANGNWDNYLGMHVLVDNAANPNNVGVKTEAFINLPGSNLPDEPQN